MKLKKCPSPTQNCRDQASHKLEKLDNFHQFPYQSQAVISPPRTFTNRYAITSATTQINLSWSRLRYSTCILTVTKAHVFIMYMY